MALVGNSILNTFKCSCHTGGPSTQKKGFFCDQLPRELAVSSKDDILYVCGEFNCHLGRCMNSFDNVQGNQGLET